MTNMLITGNSLTMSSREIATLVKSNHSDVKRSAERLQAAQLLTQPLAEFDFVHNGNTYQEYRFNKRDSLVLVARLSPEFTAAVVDRWQELESRQHLPQTFSEALRLAADLADQNQQLETQLAIAAPKVEFAERVGEAKGVLIGNFAKAIGIGPNKLFTWMREHRVLITSGARHNVPFQEYMDRGYFTVRETPVLTNHGIQISFTTLITGRGQQWLVSKLSAAGVLTERMAG